MGCVIKTYSSKHMKAKLLKPCFRHGNLQNINLVTRYMIVQIIKALQDDLSTSANAYCEVEQKYLQQMHKYDASLKLTEQQLAVDHGYSCEMI